jgi:hypothetical protein
MTMRRERTAKQQSSSSSAEESRTKKKKERKEEETDEKEKSHNHTQILVAGEKQGQFVGVKEQKQQQKEKEKVDAEKKPDKPVEELVVDHHMGNVSCSATRAPTSSMALTETRQFNLVGGTADLGSFEPHTHVELFIPVQSDSASPQRQHRFSATVSYRNQTGAFCFDMPCGSLFLHCSSLTFVCLRPETCAPSCVFCAMCVLPYLCCRRSVRCGSAL